MNIRRSRQKVGHWVGKKHQHHQDYQTIAIHLIVPVVVVDGELKRVDVLFQAGKIPGRAMNTGAMMEAVEREPADCAQDQTERE